MVVQRVKKRSLADALRFGDGRNENSNIASLADDKGRSADKKGSSADKKGFCGQQTTVRKDISYRNVGTELS